MQKKNIESNELIAFKAQISETIFDQSTEKQLEFSLKLIIVIQGIHKICLFFYRNSSRLIQIQSSNMHSIKVSSDS